MNCSRAVVALLLATPVFAFSTANGQYEEKPLVLGFGISGGSSFPLGRFGESFDRGYNVGGMVEVAYSRLPAAIRLDAQFNRFETQSADVNGDILGIGLNAVLTAKGEMSTNARPYLIGGPTWYRLSFGTADFLGTGAGGNDNRFGFNAGLGLQFGLSGAKTVIEGRYNWVKTRESSISFVPISFGIAF